MYAILYLMLYVELYVQCILSYIIKIIHDNSHVLMCMHVCIGAFIIYVWICVRHTVDTIYMHQWIFVRPWRRCCRAASINVSPALSPNPVPDQLQWAPNCLSTWVKTAARLFSSSFSFMLVLDHQKYERLWLMVKWAQDWGDCRWLGRTDLHAVLCWWVGYGFLRPRLSKWAWQLTPESVPPCPVETHKSYTELLATIWSFVRTGTIKWNTLKAGSRIWISWAWIISIVAIVSNNMYRGPCAYVLLMLMFLRTQAFTVYVQVEAWILWVAG